MKTKYFTGSLLLTCLFVGVCLTGCTDSYCIRNDRGMANFYFYSEDDTETQLQLTELTVTSFNTDSVLVNQESSVEEMNLPLDESRDSTVYVLTYAVDEVTSIQLKDTITLSYKRSAQYISAECGTAIYYTLDEKKVKFTKHAIKDLLIVNPLITEVDAHHINLFY
ncbi:MAG: DUF6452 family protein [Bacteroidaceae bacterium]